MDWIWYHALPLIVFGVPLIGFLWELLVGLLCRKNCWLLSLPVLAGALGLALCLLAQFSLSLSFLLGFWAAYGCALLFGWSISVEWEVPSDAGYISLPMKKRPYAYKRG